MAFRGFFHQNTEYNAHDLRVLAQVLLPSQGVFTATDLDVTVGASSITCSIGSGCVTSVAGALGTGGLKFIVTNDSSATAKNVVTNSTTWAPEATATTRIDNVFVKLTDEALNSSTDSVTLYYQYGTPGSGAPTLPNETCLLLANVSSASGSATKIDRRRIIGQVEELPGVIKQWGGTTAPAGYVLCDGSNLSRTVYADLFAAIGTTHGAGDGSTTFKIPDLRGRIPVGAGSGPGLTTRSMASTGGEETHTLTTAELASHSHTGTTGIESAGHTHGSGAAGNLAVLATGTGVGFASAVAPFEASNVANTATQNQNHTHTFTTAATGGGTGHNNMQPFYVVNYIIKF